MIDDWAFYRHSDERWSWRNVTLSKRSESPDDFGSFIQAMGNAIQHGFQPGLSRVTAIQNERRTKRR
jgi:hypothetical protein